VDEKYHYPRQLKRFGRHVKRIKNQTLRLLKEKYENI